uniref:Uncharacterized protein n=1 Tax=Arundo donax TaxID=35708 RepID=A0A0A8YQR2_ARUDO
MDVEAEEQGYLKGKRKRSKRKQMKRGRIGSKAGAKRQSKKTGPKSQKVESSRSDTTGNAAEPVVEKRTAQRKKQTKKASAPASDDDEDDMPALKDRLAAFNIDDPSPDNAAMEIETTGQQNENKGRKGPSKRGTAKKASSSFAAIPSDDKDEDDNFDMEEVSEVQIQKGRGRKPTAAERPKAATTRKRGPAQGKAMRQKVIDEMLKTAGDSNTSAPSPEKKVQKMRDSSQSCREAAPSLRQAPKTLLRLHQPPAAPLSQLLHRRQGGHRRRSRRQQSIFLRAMTPRMKWWS